MKNLLLKDPHRPRPYYVRTESLSLHSRDGGCVGGGGAPCGRPSSSPQ
jgi:hypothetical protein